jgi:hypothetical protein
MFQAIAIQRAAPYERSGRSNSGVKSPANVSFARFVSIRSKSSTLPCHPCRPCARISERLTFFFSTACTGRAFGSRPNGCRVKRNKCPAEHLLRSSSRKDYAALLDLIPDQRQVPIAIPGEVEKECCSAQEGGWMQQSFRRRWTNQESKSSCSEIVGSFAKYRRISAWARAKPKPWQPRQGSPAAGKAAATESPRNERQEFLQEVYIKCPSRSSRLAYPTQYLRI